MSQPLLYISPEDGQVYKVRESELVSLESIDEQVAHHQERINELNTERVKFLELTTVDAATAGNDQQEPAQPEQPAEQPGTVEQQLAAAGADASENQTAAAPSEPVAPAEQPAAPADPASDPSVAEDITTATAAPSAPVEAVGEPSDPSAASNDPATPPIAA